MKFVNSIWEKETVLPQYESLKQDLTVDVAVIGAGIAGILTAYLLQKQGVNVVVLEAKTIGSGQTGKTTAKVTSQHNLIYHKLVSSLGTEQAKLYADANQEAIGMYRNLAKRCTDAVAFEEKENILYAVQNADAIEKEVKAMQQLGLKADLITQTELPFPVAAAVSLEGQAQFQPLAFLKEISSDLTIFEHTMVQNIEDQIVKTKQGNITAKHIVIATHYPFINIPGYYFLRQHQERSYVLALKNAPQYRGMYLGVDEPCLAERHAEREKIVAAVTTIH